MQEVQFLDARVLRVRLVREVAAVKAQAISVENEKGFLSDKMRSFEKEQADLLGEISNEAIQLLKNTNSEKTFADFQEKYAACQRETEEQRKELNGQLQELEEKAKCLNRQAREALTEIVNDILAGKYGRGEIELSCNEGFVRVFGRIEEMEWPSADFALSISAKHRQFSCHDVQRVAQRCEMQEVHPLFIRVNVDVMPLSEEEIVDLYQSYESFVLLKKYLPAGALLWDLNVIYCLRKEESVFETYLVSLSREKTVLAKVEMLEYPRRKVEIMGSISRDENTLNALCVWGIFSKPLFEVEKVSEQDVNFALSMLAKHLFYKHPGLILEMPQLEK